MARSKASKAFRLRRRALLGGALSLPALSSSGVLARAGGASVDPRLASFVQALLPIGTGVEAERIRAAAAHRLEARIRDPAEEALRKGYLIFALSWTPKLAKKGLEAAEALLTRLFAEPAHRKALDAALDAAYAAFAELEGIDQALWGGRYARRGESCMHWDRYDKKP